MLTREIKGKVEIKVKLKSMLKNLFDAEVETHVPP